VKKAYQPVKILSSGEITSAIDISADMFSKVAVEKIEKAGGKVTYL
jgi:large subunit ribosomal protein L15